VSDETTDLYDLRGLNCPLPVLKTRKRLSSLPDQTELRIWTDDPLALIDVPNFCREQGHELLEATAMESGHQFVIRKGA